MDAKGCGSTHLKIIVKYDGKYYSLQYLCDLCGITREGVTFLDISYATERYFLILCTHHFQVNDRILLCFISVVILFFIKHSHRFTLVNGIVY